MNSSKKQSILGLIPLFEVMSSLNVDPETVLQNHDLDISSLSGSALIARELEFKIIEDACRLIDDPLFGLKVGSQSTFTSYGTFALLVMTAPTFRDACQTSVQFQELSLLFMHLSLHFEKDYFEMRYALPNTAPEIQPFIADRDFAGTFGFINELMNDTDSDMIQCGIARPKPDRNLLKAYQSIGKFELLFDQAYSWIRLSNKFLNTKLKHANSLAHKLYRVQALEILRQFYPKNEDIATQVRQIFDGYDSQYPNVNEVAKVFGISERTLRRKLDESQLSYRQLIDQHRKSKALTLLSSGNIPVSQLAESLGYTEPASFLRAFKRWTGMTPKQFNQNLEQQST